MKLVLLLSADEHKTLASVLTAAVADMDETLAYYKEHGELPGDNAIPEMEEAKTTVERLLARL